MSDGCTVTSKIVAVIFISPYMVKKYGYSVALSKVLARKKYKYLYKCGS